MRAPHPHHDLTALTEPDTGLVRAPVLRYLLERKLALSARTLVPLTLVAIRVDGGQDARARVGAIVGATLRSADSVGALDAQHLAMVLDDTSETGGVWAAERVRTELGATMPTVASGAADHAGAAASSVAFGVACYPTHAVDADALVTAALDAVAAGRRHGPNRIEVARTAVGVGSDEA